jgi:hypothetical protein
MTTVRNLAAALAASLLVVLPVEAEEFLGIAMTASDVGHVG